MRIVFMGTPDIAVPALRRMAAEHEIVGVYCQPDKPVGRKQVLTAPPVKLTAQELNIPVFQPATLRTPAAAAQLQQLAPDLIAVIAYGKILPKEILSIPPKGCVNAHASVLPKYRGAAPIQRAILAGESATGVTAIIMDEGIDTGDVIEVRKIAIAPQDDAGSMFQKLGALSADVFSGVLRDIATGAATAVPQDDAGATHAPPIKKEEGLFDFSQPAEEIVNRVRAFCIWPNAFFSCGDKTIKVLKAQFNMRTGKPGEILSVNPLVIAAGGGSVELCEVMPQNSKRMPGSAFAAGQRLKAADNIIEKQIK